jgi:hypothetical protein
MDLISCTRGSNPAGKSRSRVLPRRPDVRRTGASWPTARGPANYRQARPLRLPDDIKVNSYGMVPGATSYGFTLTDPSGAAVPTSGGTYGRWRWSWCCTDTCQPFSRDPACGSISASPSAGCQQERFLSAGASRGGESALNLMSAPVSHRFTVGQGAFARLIEVASPRSFATEGRSE